MNREYPYQITLLLYSGKRETHYIKASDRHDAFSKAHRFSNRFAFDSRDGCQFINVYRLTKQYCADHGITFEC